MPPPAAGFFSVSIGAAGTKRNYYVDVETLFSEEEKGIIQARGLYGHNFTIGPAIPPRSFGHFVGAGWLRGVYRIILVVGVIVAIAYSGALGGLLFFVGIVMGITGFIMDRRGTIEESNPPQTLTLRRLLDNPRITIYAVDPADAKTVDDQLREHLADIKNLIEESAAIRAKETFEL
jgi:hypothetical protein